MAALDWEKIDLSAITDEEQLWELLATAQEHVQEMAHAVWTQAGKLNSSSGFASIKEMIPAPPRNMSLLVQLKFFRTKGQRLRRTAGVISSDLVSSQCATQIQICSHLPPQDYFPGLQFQAPLYESCNNFLGICAHFRQGERNLRPFSTGGTL